MGMGVGMGVGEVEGEVEVGNVKMSAAGKFDRLPPGRLPGPEVEWTWVWKWGWEDGEGWQ